MRKHFIAASMLFAVALNAPAAVLDLKGFDYGQADAPTGDEWQSPGKLAYNKLQPRAYFFSFGNVDNARKVLPENSD